MIPWASPSLLASNPAFAQLHKRLVTDILDHDGTTLAAPAAATTRSLPSHVQQQHGHEQQQSNEPSSSALKASASDRLTAHRVSIARRQILANVLFEVALVDDQDQDDGNNYKSKNKTNNNNDDDNQDDVLAMQEAALTIATYLHRYRLLSPQQQHLKQQQQQQQQELLKLLLSDISTLRRNRARLSARVLAQYQVLKDIGRAAAAAAAAKNRTNISSSSAPELPDLVSSQLKHLQELQTQTLPRARYNATNAAVELLRAQAEEAEWLVRWLEQRRHGAEARYVAGRARWLATVARGMAAKAEVAYLEAWRGVGGGGGGGDDDSSGNAHDQVRQRINQLEEEEDELDRRKSELSEALAEYEEHGVSIAIMEQLGKRYADIESEIDQVKADLDRLSLRRSSPQWL